MLRLGFDSYSLRAFGWKAPKLLEFAAAQKLDAIQLSDLDDYETLEPTDLAKVKAQADAAGIVIGAKVPIILTSRADSERTRLASCAVAVLLAYARQALGAKS